MGTTSAARAIGLLLGCLVAAGCSGTSAPDGTGGHGSPAPSTSAPGTSGAAPAYVTSRVGLGRKPCGIVAAGERIWVSNYGEATLQWFDRGDRLPSAPIPVGDQPCGVAVGGGSVWVENYGGNSVTRVDEQTGRVLATIDVGGVPYDVAYAAGAAWVTDWADGTVSRVDAKTNRRTVVRTGGQPAGIAPVGNALWVPLSDSGVVVRIDARRAKVTDRVRAGDGANWTAYGDHDLWVSNGMAGTVTRIDTRTRRAVAMVTVGPKPEDGVFVDGAVWVPDANGQIYRIDPASDTVTAHVMSGVGNPFVITGTGKELWAADFLGSEAVRIDLTELPD